MKNIQTSIIILGAIKPRMKPIMGFIPKTKNGINSIMPRINPEPIIRVKRSDALTYIPERIRVSCKRTIHLSGKTPSMVFDTGDSAEGMRAIFSPIV
jgi:hypothetical protein